MSLLSFDTYSTISRAGQPGPSGRRPGLISRVEDGLTVRRNPSFRIVLPVLIGLVALTALPAQAQTRKSKASQPSIARKAVSARARAVATAREMADTTVPRYKVDA